MEQLCLRLCFSLTLVGISRGTNESDAHEEGKRALREIDGCGDSTPARWINKSTGCEFAPGIGLVSHINKDSGIRQTQQTLAIARGAMHQPGILSQVHLRITQALGPEVPAIDEGAAVYVSDKHPLMQPRVSRPEITRG